MPSRSLVPDDSPHGPPAPRRNHLLVIGVDAYVHLRPLNNAVRDAKAIRQVLESRYQFDPQHIHELYDRDASRRNILRQLQHYERSLSADDNLLIYFSGHGDMKADGTTGFWIPAEAEAGSHEDYVSNSDVMDRLRSMQAHHIYLICDSCFAGTLIVRKAELEEKVESKPSRRVLASGQKEPVMDGIAGGHSPFAAALLECLNEMRGQPVAAEEIELEVKKYTARNSYQLPDAAYLFGLGDKGGQFVFHRRVSLRDEMDRLRTARDIAGFRRLIELEENGLRNEKLLAAAEKTLESLRWEQVKAQRNPWDLAEFLEIYPRSEHHPAAVDLVRELIRDHQIQLEELEKLEAENRKLRESKLSQRDEITKLNTELKALETRLQESRQAEKDHTQQLQTLEQALQAAAAELESQSASHTQQLQALEQALQAAAAELESQSASHTQQLQVRDTQLQTLGQALQAAAAELESQSASHTQQIQTLEQEIAALRAAPQILIPKPGILFPEMIFIRGGTFQMGSEAGDSDEKPVRKVTVPDFFLGKYPVTVSEYLAFCRQTGGNWPEWMEQGSSYHYQKGTNDYYKQLGDALTADRNPIVGVSWDDAQAYCRWLAEQTGTAFRLPSESEWEYAAGGGAEGRTKWARTDEKQLLGEYAWYDKNSGGQTHPVGQKNPNRLGLYDLSGNVWEWCEDYWHSDYKGAPSDGSAWVETGNTGLDRVYRGGSWGYDARDCRVSCRGHASPGRRSTYLGFRLAAPPVQQR
ncbi:MAG: SUMF1/EgtB/PvdO family nonheme iron enzyme [Bacteroidia bacterium]|nr:SUMF1/EgtB/PvdO family nonheme iron enzyme [Bacteroidia bacterium]